MSKNTTDTNQASEHELDNILLDALNEGWFLRSKQDYPNGFSARDVKRIRDKAKIAIQSIIRTEKLKLLAELEEYSEVMNSDVVPIYGVPMSVIYTLRAKLEAEL